MLKGWRSRLAKKYFVGSMWLQEFRAEDKSHKASEEEKKGFELILLNENEWEDLPRLLEISHDPAACNSCKEWLNRLKPKKPAGEQVEVKRGSVSTKQEGRDPVERARAERLGAELYYVCYLDVNIHGQEHPIQMFLNGSRLVIINWGGFSLTRLEHWVQVTHLDKPLDLVQLLGQFVLHCHQDRLEKIEDRMDKLEEAILKHPQRWQQNEIMTLHRMVLRLKKSVNAHQFAFSRLANLEDEDKRSRWIELAEDARHEMDNIRQTHELVENLREAYQASLDVHSNEIMKVLTVMASLLLPVSILTSFFGMNFANLPLIDNQYGIWIFFVLTIVTVIIAIVILNKKHWLK